MNNKLLAPIIAISLLGIMWLSFLLNPSYEHSIKAKYYYEMGEYEEALSLAKEAFNLDIYNRMASTIMAQSITSLKYTSYINDAKKYMIEINSIASHEYITDADKAKIRLICSIMISAYVKLAPSVVTDKELVQEAARYYDKYEKLFEKVNKKL